MAEPVTINLRHVARGLGIPLGQVQAAVELLDEGNTVPFVTRYRKDQTGGLDEEQIRQIQARLTKLRLLAERKQTILRSIESQGKLTEKLSKQIHAAGTAKRLEDLYLPYRPKKQTLAAVARSRGLEPLANEILSAEPTCDDLDARAADFVNPDRQVPTAADALLGAGHILAEQFSERAELRQRLREILHRSGKLVSTRIGGESKAADKPQKPEAGAPSAAADQPNKADPSLAQDKQGTSEQPSEPNLEQPNESKAADKPQKPEAGAPSAAADQPNKADASLAQDKQGTSEQPSEPNLEQPNEPNPGPTEPNPGQPTGPNPGPTEPNPGQPTGPNPGPTEPNPGQPTEPDPGPIKPNAGQATEATADPSPSSLAEPSEPAGPHEEPPAESQAQVQPRPESEADDPPPQGPQVQGDASKNPHDATDPSSAEAAVDGKPKDQSQKVVEKPVATRAGQRAEGGEPTEPAAEAEPEPPAPPLPQSPPPAPSEAKPKRAAPRRLTKKDLKKKKAEEKRQKAFADYFDYREEIKKIPPHRVLAINRGERAKVLRVRIEADAEAMHRALEEICAPDGHPHAEFLRGCARDALARLILPSLEREVRRDLTERAEAHAVGVFARNLRNLLLQPPVRQRRVLAVDPGYRSGCKLAALDQFGNMLAHGVIYLVGKPERKQEATRIVGELFDHFQLTLVAIGNGTACREAEDFFAGLIADEMKDRDVAYVIVNEAGASVYSTSRLGREEFPEYDASLRGAISIGRRLQDPLSELVKIEPANIGVGLYQHDVKAKHLQTSLDEVVESCVNYVGVDVNTASPALLRYVSGLNQLTARRLHEHRLQNGPFRNRDQLRQVPGFGEATFVQAAGFLKITGGDNPLDATWIHPESYLVASRVMAELGCTPADLVQKDSAGTLGQRISQVNVPALAEDLGVGGLLLKDILAQLARPGRDPREDLPGPVFKQGVLKLEDLTVGMELTGTVLNVVDFGAFVDIGLHDSGLVHVSQLADKFVRDPHDVIAVGDVIRVWVLEVDKERRRVSLTMIRPGAKRGRPRREGKPPERRAADRAAEPRPEARSRGKGPPRGKPRGPSRPRFKPKGRPKPVIPITDDMKAGKEPMRSFSDLAQFFQVEQGGSPKRAKKAKPKPPKHEASRPKDKPAKDEHGQAPTKEDQDRPPEEPTATEAAQQPSPEAQQPSDHEKIAPEEQQAAQAESQVPSAQPDQTQAPAETQTPDSGVAGPDAGLAGPDAGVAEPDAGVAGADGHRREAPLAEPPEPDGVKSSPDRSQTQPQPAGEETRSTPDEGQPADDPSQAADP